MSSESLFTVDRAARNGLIRTIEFFLNEEITSDQFDEARDEYLDTDDQTVYLISREAWFYYSDIEDHPVALSKPNWDDLQRLLLILISNRHIESKTRRRWSWSQAAPSAFLIGYISLAIPIGWGVQLVALSIPFGLASIAFSLLKQAAQESFPEHREARYTPAIAPFSSFGELRETHQETPSFKKMQYPAHLSHRRIRSRVEDAFLRVHMYTAWMTLSPFALLCQSWPATELETRIIPD